MILRTILTTLCLLLSTALYAAPLVSKNTEKNLQQPVITTILSIIPSQGEPGTKINLDGSGFGQSSKVFLGSQEVSAISSSDKQIEFMIPIKQQAGVYALYLQRQDGTNSRPYNFTVLSMRPLLRSIIPEQIPSCSLGDEREITVNGQNFTETSQLFFDGVVIGSRFKSAETISFTAPQVAGGLHQIMVKNSPDNGSVAMGLMISTKPEIDHVTIGNEFVNYYELMIEGKNFQQNSAITVDGIRVGGHSGDDLAAREKLIYLGCTKLIYQRHPYSPVSKEFRIQAVNSSGEGSQVITVNAP